MFTVNKYEKVSRENFIKNCVVKEKTAAYVVSGIEVKDLVGTYDELNSFLVDTIIEDGYLLGDVSYRFVPSLYSTNGTAKIEVFVGDLTDYLKNE
jgi:hypothetical protein